MKRLVLRLGTWAPFVAAMMLCLSLTYAEGPISPHEVSTKMFSDAEDLPLYPDATQVQVDNKWLDAWQKTTFTTSEKGNSVLTYYRNLLLQKGWILENGSSTAGLGAFWSDNSGAAPSNLFLFMTVSLSLSGQTNITILQRRYPNTDKLPLLKDAKQLNVNYTKDKEYGFPVRIMSYVTRERRDIVKDYYNTNLLLQGWQHSGEINSARQHDNLSFFYTFSSGGGQLGAHLDIIINPLRDGYTAVELELSGFGIEPPK